jgi:membrane protease YdiL (CAAX protease family)
MSSNVPPAPSGLSPRGGLVRAGWFAGLTLAMAAATFVAGPPPALTPFLLVLEMTVLAFVLAWQEGHGALRGLWRSLTIRPADRRWWLVLALPIAWAFATVGIGVALGAPTGGLFDRVVPSIFIVPLVVLLPAIAEELAWRGYVLPRLLAVMSPLTAALVLAVPWTMVHLPLFLPGQQYDGLALWAMALSIFAYSILLTWVYVRTGGSVLLTTLLHAGFNGVAPIMAGFDNDDSWAIRNLLVAAIALGVVALGGLRGAGASRTGRPRIGQAATTAVAILVVGSLAGPASIAASPGNDLPAGATVITSLPYALDQDTTEAGVGSDDVGCGAGGFDVATVWYSFVPAEDVRVEIDARRSNYLVGVNLFIGSATEDGRADCNNDALAFDAQAGTTYYLLFADVNDDGVNGGHLEAEIGVARPSLNMTMTVDPTGLSHPKTGQARITGTVTCDRPAIFADVSAVLRLETGRFVTIGGGGDSPACSPTPSPWSAIVTGENGRFPGGAATVQLSGLACDLLSCNETATDGTVRLRRGVFELPDLPEEETASLAGAAAPANDEIGSPTVIGAIPFTETIDTTGATTGPTDPDYCFGPEFGPDPASVWYAYTADATGPLLATTFDSDYDTSLYVGTADGDGGLAVIACSDDTRSQQSAVRFDAVAGETYLFAASASPFGGATGGNLTFNLEVGPPAQAVELHVESVGLFTGYGTATIRGTVSCAAPATLGSIVIVELLQRVGNRELPGNAFLDIGGCPAVGIPFEAVVWSPYGKYRGGHASAQVIYAACSDIECGSETVDLRVNLRR